MSTWNLKNVIEDGENVVVIDEDDEDDVVTVIEAGGSCVRGREEDVSVKELEDDVEWDGDKLDKGTMEDVDKEVEQVGDEGNGEENFLWNQSFMVVRILEGTG